MHHDQQDRQSDQRADDDRQRDRVITAEAFENGILNGEGEDAKRKRGNADQVAGMDMGGRRHVTSMLGSMLIRHPWRGMIDPLAAYDAWPATAGNLEIATVISLSRLRDPKSARLLLTAAWIYSLVTNRIGEAVGCGAIEVRQREGRPTVAAEVDSQ